MGKQARAARIEVALETAHPFDPAWPLGFFARRAVRGAEEVLPDGSYRRSVRLAHGPAVIELHSSSRTAGQSVRGAARLTLADRRDRPDAEQICRELLDLDHAPQPVIAALGRDPVIGPLIAVSPGLRVPGTSDPHELAFRAVLGQQVSLAGAATLAARLTAAHGEPLARPAGAVTHLFPTAAALAELAPADLPMPASRGRALVGLAAALRDRTMTLSRETDPAQARADLTALPGIGPWTAEYVAMRALRDPDAFMATDLGVKHALTRLGLDPSPKAATALAKQWRPYRAYAMQHLWALL